MRSAQVSIYEHEEVIYTLAWLSGCNAGSSSENIINRAIQLDLITVLDEGRWEANENNIFRCIGSSKVTFPHHKQTKELTNILIGFGEISARSHGDFMSLAQKKFTTSFYRKSLLKIAKDFLRSKCFLKRKYSLRERGYSQNIARTVFDWKGYGPVIEELYYNSSLFIGNWGTAFIVELIMKVLPTQYSIIVEENKTKTFVIDLCRPVIEPLIFGGERDTTPLLKSKNAYLKLLACAYVVKQERGDQQSFIGEDIKTLVSNEVRIGDAIWLSSVKFRDHYLGVERINGQVKAARNRVLLLEKNPSNCPEGVNAHHWITEQKDALARHEIFLVEADNRLKKNFDDIKVNWPQEGIEGNQIENIINLFENNELSRELAEIIPSNKNKKQLLDSVHKSIKEWLGVPLESISNVCKETFLYSSEKDLLRIVNAAKTLVMLSNIKSKPIGKFLGSTVGASVQVLENFVSSPYMSVRKPSQWQSATSRLASIHLLAMCIFEETPEDKENEISTIVPMVVESINRLLKVQNAPFHLGADELFKDLKRITAYIIATKNFSEASAEGIAIDEGLPSDYRVRVIVTNESLIVSHKTLLLDLFEEFSRPPIYVDRDYNHFSSWMSLLDICIAYCWKFEATLEAQEIIGMWEKYCPLYNDCEEYVEYAGNLFMALSEDGKDRDWLMGLDGFEQSNCMNFLKRISTQSD